MDEKDILDDDVIIYKTRMVGVSTGYGPLAVSGALYKACDYIKINGIVIKNRWGKTG